VPFAILDTVQNRIYIIHLSITLNFIVYKGTGEEFLQLVNNDDFHKRTAVRGKKLFFLNVVIDHKYFQNYFR